MTFAARTLMDAGAGGGGPPTPPPFAPVIHRFTFVGTFTETIPNPGGGVGPAQVLVELGGPGGGGSFSPYMTRVPPGVSGSGGSGALCRYTIPLTPADWGKTLTITINPGAPGGEGQVDFNGRNALPCTIVNNTFTTPVNMSAGGGYGGTWNPGAGGAGGVASGGQQPNGNISGNPGQGNTLYPNLSQGGAPVGGTNISSGAGGNASSVANGNGSPGQPGAAAFSYV